MSTTRRAPRIRAGFAMMIVALMGLAKAGATSPSPDASSPIQSPTASMRSGEIEWVPVDGFTDALPGGAHGASMGAAQVVAWTGGYAALGDGVWVSSDGRAWTGYALPSEIDRQGLSLLAWNDGLLVVEQRPRERGWRFRLWSSADGSTWRRAGTFDQRPVGKLEECAFTYPYVVATEARILAMADCVPYANGRTRPAVAELTAVSEPSVPIWAWTSDDGTRWGRHLVADELDRAGTGRSPVLVRAIGDGFAAILCCHPPSVWRSEDGATWREIMALPPTVGHEAIEALDAFVLDGRPKTWLLMGDKDHEISEGGSTGALGTLWTGDGSSWTEVIGQPDWQDGAIATDGEVAVAVTARITDADPERIRLVTITSTVGGRSWTVSEGEEIAPSDCCLGDIAMHGDRAFLTGPWGPDSVSLRRADIYGSAP